MTPAPPVPAPRPVMIFVPGQPGPSLATWVLAWIALAVALTGLAMAASPGLPELLGRYTTPWFYLAQWWRFRRWLLIRIAGRR